MFYLIRQQYQRYKKAHHQMSLAAGFYNSLYRLRHVMAESSIRPASDLPTAAGNCIKIVMLKGHRCGDRAKQSDTEI